MPVLSDTITTTPSLFWILLAQYIFSIFLLLTFFFFIYCKVQFFLRAFIQIIYFLSICQQMLLVEVFNTFVYNYFQGLHLKLFNLISIYYQSFLPLSFYNNLLMCSIGILVHYFKSLNIYSTMLFRVSSLEVTL